MMEPAAGFIAACEISLKEGSFVKLSLDNHFGAELDLTRIYARKILVKKEERLSFTYRYKKRDIVKNYTFDEGTKLLSKLLTESFRGATLYTTEFDLRLESRTGGKATMKKSIASSSKPASLAHDREKKRLIAPGGKPWMHDLGITDAAGNVLKNAQDKYRQINKYVEILSGLIAQLPAEKCRKVVDMGCGKGYLTFALYDYMTQTLGMQPQITGVDTRADMVELCNGIAQKSGFEGLRFEQGIIAQYDSSGTDILIALHACDTATDEALYQGIAADAGLIVVAPCCHKQIRKQIEVAKADNALDFLTRHGIFAERQAEMVTDGLRALLLEYCGYGTKVFEFISDAHTPKNVMIVAVKNKADARRNPTMLEKIKTTKSYFGIQYHHLERMLGL